MRLVAVSWRPDHLDPPRPVSAPAVRANRHQAVQSSRRRNGTRCRAACPRGAAREDWRNHGTHSRMRRARGKPKSGRMDDGNRDAGVHEGEPEQGVRPRLVGRDRLVRGSAGSSWFRGRPWTPTSSREVAGNDGGDRPGSRPRPGTRGSLETRGARGRP